MEIVMTGQSTENMELAGHLGFLAESQPARVHEGSIGNCLHGGFTRDFAIADRVRVMMAALTRRQFADLAKITRLSGWPGSPALS